MGHPLRTLIGLVILLGSAACGGPRPPTQAAVGTAASPPLPPTSEATPFPWILVGGEAPTEVQEAVTEWAAQMGLDARVAPVEADSEAPGGLMAAIGTEAELGPAAQTWSEQGVYVVVLNAASTEPAAFRSTVGPDRREDQAGFLAGLAAGMTTRTAGIGLLRDPAGADAAFASGFDEGVRYLCPRCRQESVASMDAIPYGVDVVAVAPGATLTDEPPAGAPWIIPAGGQPAGWADRVAARVGEAPETLVLQALESLTGGQPGQAWVFDAEDGGLLITGVNSEAISPGRERLMREAEIGLRLGTLAVGGGE